MTLLDLQAMESDPPDGSCWQSRCGCWMSLARD